MPAPKGNRYAEVRSVEEWIKLFEQIRDKAMEGAYNSLQQAWIKNKIPPSTATWLCKEYEVLASIKKDIGEAVVSHVNDMALEGKYNATASIWRMKQLGERDEKHLDHTTKGESVKVTPIAFDD